MQAIEVARSVAATRRSLRRRTFLSVACFVAAATLLLVAWSQSRADERANAIQRDGTQTDAVVTRVTPRPVGHGQLPNGWIDVRFAPNGIEQDASVFVGRRVSDFRVDQVVDVAYDPSNPSLVQIVGVTPITRGLPVLPTLTIGLLLLAMGVVSARHVGRISRLVGEEPWLAIRSSVSPTSAATSRYGPRHVVVLAAADGPVTVSPIGYNRVDPTFQPLAWVVGLSERMMVLAVPGGGHLVLVRRVG